MSCSFLALNRLRAFGDTGDDSEALTEMQHAMESLEEEVGMLSSSIPRRQEPATEGGEEGESSKKDSKDGIAFRSAVHVDSHISDFSLLDDNDNVFALPSLSQQLDLDTLWEMLGDCLTALADSTDSHAVLVLQPAVEAFFLVHGTEKASASTAVGKPKQDRSASYHGYRP